MRRHLAALLVALALAGCTQPPPTLSPAGIRDYRANEAVLAIGTVQAVAISLNGIQVCDPAPCRPLVSDRNTRRVIDAVEVALKTIQAAPNGWKTATLTAVTTIRAQLEPEALAKLDPYLVTVLTVVASLEAK